MSDDVLREQVATACRIVAQEGYLDLTLGHVSARIPGARTVWIKRMGVALDEVRPEDVLPLDLDDPKAFEDRRHHLEAIMHAEIYRVRPDVGAVIHGHPTYATALAAVDGRLEFLTHDAVLFADGLGEYVDGPNLITTPEQGARVAAALGTRRAALLRNHGVVVAGEDIRWAVLTAVTLERAIHFQVLAGQLGALRPISQDDATRLRPLKYQDRILDDYWAAWQRRVRLVTGGEFPAAG